MSHTHRQERHLPDDQPVVIASPSADEWIVGERRGGRALHIYRVTPTDWLVSEAGRSNEGRGDELERALTALAGDGPGPTWWQSIPALLAEADGHTR